MSRSRGIEAKVKKEILHSVKKKNEPDTTCGKDDTVETNQVAELLVKLPKLAKTFEVHRKIGEGTFSSVYLGSMRHHSGIPDAQKKWYAIKHLVPTTHPTRVAHELRCLRDIGGKHNVIGVELCLRNLDNVVFIMPYVPHRKFSDYMSDMDAEELRRYMHALLTALRHVHSFGVIHRDVKPSNFLYDRDNQRYALVDFGLAQHTVPPVDLSEPSPAHQPPKRPHEDVSGDSPLPSAKRMALDLSVHALAVATPPTQAGLQLNANVSGKQTNNMSPPPAHSRPPQGARACSCAGLDGVCSECLARATPRANRAGTQGFRPPEVLFKFKAQSTAVDIWASGVVLLSVLTGRYPFFRAADDMTALAEIVALLGTAAMHRTATALECRLITSTPREGICLRKLSEYLRGPPAISNTDAACVECCLPPSHCVCRDNSAPGHEIDAERTHAGFPDSAFALAYCLLEPDPCSRITAEEALQHPFLQP